MQWLVASLHARVGHQGLGLAGVTILKVGGAQTLSQCCLPADNLSGKDEFEGCPQIEHSEGQTATAGLKVARALSSKPELLRCCVSKVLACIGYKCYAVTCIAPKLDRQLKQK